MREIKIILLIISITFISCSKEDQIIVPEVPDPLEDKIGWDIISGKIAYKENDKLYLADKTSRTVKNLGNCYLFNLKWNKIFYFTFGTFWLEFRKVLSRSSQCRRSISV